MGNCQVGTEPLRTEPEPSVVRLNLSSSVCDEFLLANQIDSDFLFTLLELTAVSMEIGSLNDQMIIRLVGSHIVVTQFAVDPRVNRVNPVYFPLLWLLCGKQEQ